jgi:hypothetical protein
MAGQTAEVSLDQKSRANGRDLSLD